LALLESTNPPATRHWIALAGAFGWKAVHTDSALKWADGWGGGCLVRGRWRQGESERMCSGLVGRRACLMGQDLPSKTATSLTSSFFPHSSVEEVI
jgi:hypothetical protein